MALLDRLLMLYWYVILVRVVLSWVNVSPSNPFARIIYVLTEPVLAPVRRLLPPMGGMDLSPLLIFAAIWFLRTLI